MNTLMGVAYRWHAAVVLADDLPNPTPTAPPGVAGPFTTFLGWVMWLAGGAGVLGFMILAVRLALSDQRESTMEQAKTFARICGGLILVAGASGLARIFL